METYERTRYSMTTDVADELLADSKLGSDWVLRHSVERHESMFAQRLMSSATCLWDYNRFDGDGPVMDASYLRWWLWSLVKDSEGWWPGRLWKWLRGKIEPQVPSSESIQNSIIAQRYWLEEKGLEPRAVIVHPNIRWKLESYPATWFCDSTGFGANMEFGFCGLRVIVNDKMRRWGAYVV